MNDQTDPHEDDDLEDLPPMMPDHPKRMLVEKGQEINITKMDPTIREITVGIGWDMRVFEGDPVDMDASVFLLDKFDKTREDQDFVFYNNLVGRDGAVRHMGDSRTGAGDGDDEKIVIDLMALPFEVVKIAFTVSIYDMDLSTNNFTQVKNVYFRIVNNETTHETFRFELDEDMGKGTGLFIGYLERVGSDWVYQAVGQPVEGGLSQLATDYGIVVAQNVRA